MKAPCLRQAFADIMLLKQPSKFHSENSKRVSCWGCAVQQVSASGCGFSPLCSGEFYTQGSPPASPRGRARKCPHQSAEQRPLRAQKGQVLRRGRGGRSGHTHVSIGTTSRVNRWTRKHLIAKESLLNRQDS